PFQSGHDLVKPVLAAHPDKQAAIDQDPLSKHPQLSHLWSETLVVWDVCKEEICGCGDEASKLLQVLKSAVIQANRSIGQWRHDATFRFFFVPVAGRSAFGSCDVHRLAGTVVWQVLDDSQRLLKFLWRVGDDALCVLDGSQLP